MLVVGNSMEAGADSFRQALRQARHPIALAGAGLSAASGIPTFRGAGGTSSYNFADDRLSLFSRPDVIPHLTLCLLDAISSV